VAGAAGGWDVGAVDGVFERGGVAGGGALALLWKERRDFRAAVIRVQKGEEAVVEVLTKFAGPDINWEKWRDVPLGKEQAIAGEAYAKGRPVVLRDITAADRTRFINWDWIEENGLRACICYPLVVGERVLGTMTLFLSRRDQFQGPSLMATFANAFALFWDQVRATEQEGVTRTKLVELQAKHEEGRLHDRSSVILHSAKNGWRELQVLMRHLEKLDIDGRAKEVLRRAKELSERELKGLLDDDTSLDPRAFDVVEELRQMMKERQLQLRDGRIRLKLDLKPVPLIKMPEHEFKEVINNLVANAIWAIRETGRGSGELEVGAESQGRGKQEEVVIWVADDGVGVPRDKLDEIFKRGYSSSKATGGTGLGLFLSRQLAQSYGGEVTVESRFGIGSRFEVRWPLHWIRA